MDDAHFDAITRRLAAPRSRRGALSALLAGVGGIALLGRTAAAPLRTCSGSHFECPGKQLCNFDDATGQLRCANVEGLDHSEGRVCKGEFEHTYCQRTSQCCVYPEIRDISGGPVLELVPNCCDDGLICDTERGCVPRPGAE
jgi:hypothetical protein